MKIVRIDNNAVYEVIPEHALPVETFYGAEFAALCVEAPDYVDQGWIFNSDGTWTNPEDVHETEIVHGPTTEERIALLEAQLAETDEVTIDLYESIVKVYRTLGGIDDV